MGFARGAEWETFVPAPGDYVRYDNAYGGHSGLVRYVSEDDETLYTFGETWAIR